jgi:hypothetical protein
VQTCQPRGARWAARGCPRSSAGAVRHSSIATRDPLAGIDGTTTVANPYHYADNDPLNKTDPTGLRVCDAALNLSGQMGVKFNDPGASSGGSVIDQIQSQAKRLSTCSQPFNSCLTTSVSFDLSGAAFSGGGLGMDTCKNNPHVDCRNEYYQLGLPDYYTRCGPDMGGVDWPTRDVAEIAGIFLDAIDLGLCGYDVATTDSFLDPHVAYSR